MLSGRMFVDECHVCLTDATYRDALNVLLTRLVHIVPLLLTTTTMPPFFIPWLKQRLNVTALQVERTPVKKANIAYEVKGVADGPQAMTDAVLAAVEKVSEVQDGGRALIFCVSVRFCLELSRELDIPAFYFNIDEERKKEVMFNFRHGAEGQRIQWLVTTTALGCGIDVNEAHTVLHAGRPYNVIDLV